MSSFPYVWDPNDRAWETRDYTKGWMPERPEREDADASEAERGAQLREVGKRASPLRRLSSENYTSGEGGWMMMHVVALMIVVSLIEYFHPWSAGRAGAREIQRPRASH